MNRGGGSRTMDQDWKKGLFEVDASCIFGVCCWLPCVSCSVMKETTGDSWCKFCLCEAVNPLYTCGFCQSSMMRQDNSGVCLCMPCVRGAVRYVWRGSLGGLIFSDCLAKDTISKEPALQTIAMDAFVRVVLHTRCIMKCGRSCSLVYALVMKCVMVCLFRVCVTLHDTQSRKLWNKSPLGIWKRYFEKYFLISGHALEVSFNWTNSLGPPIYFFDNYTYIKRKYISCLQ